MAGRYTEYPEYKSTDEVWLGNIPANWKVVQIKYIADSVNTGGTPKELSSFTEEPEVFWFSPSDFHNGHSLEKANKYVTWRSVNSKDSKIYRANSVLVIGIGATLGKVAHCSKAFSCNQQINVISPNSNVNSFFLMYSLSVQSEQMIQSSNASTIGIMNQEKTKDIAIALPTNKEQQKIASFLDHETAKIDTLIAKQEKLIELLKEKRQAVISHAVTKGLNPNAPMRDSGVEWLGEVPEHWVVGRVKNLAKLISKGTTPSTIGGDFVDSGIRFLKGENIGKSIFVNPSPAFHISEEVDAQLSRSRLQENDVLVIIAGATTGKASILTKELLPANTNQAVSFIRPKKASYSKLIAFWLSTDFAQRVIWMGAVQAAQPNLSMEDLGNLPIVLPTEDEIAPLLFEIDKKLEQFDLLVKKANGAIKLMQERKTALISAAVTGKIDVRHFVAEQGQPQEFKVE